MANIEMRLLCQDCGRVAYNYKGVPSDFYAEFKKRHELCEEKFK